MAAAPATAIKEGKNITYIYTYNTEWKTTYSGSQCDGTSQCVWLSLSIWRAESSVQAFWDSITTSRHLFIYIFIWKKYIYIRLYQYIEIYILYMSRAQQRSSSCICIVSAITWFSIIQLVCRSTLFFSLSLFLLFVSLNQSISVFLIVAHFYRSWNFWMWELLMAF